MPAADVQFVNALIHAIGVQLVEQVNGTRNQILIWGGIHHMTADKILLTDDQMADFIANGYLKLNTDFSAEFHQTVMQKLNEVYKDEGNPGNNLLPRIPEIGRFFEHPVVSGALTSILGPDYIMSAHRHGHLTKSGAGQVGWHKDNYWLNEKIRNHHPWSVIIFYYTQDVTEVMGPSALMPGTQNYYLKPGDAATTKKVTGKAGSMALIAYDLWHTATHNQSDIDRYMLKFQFFRMDAPKSPTWNNKSSMFISPGTLQHGNEHRLMWEHEWNWLSGKTNGIETEESTLPEEAVQEQERIRQLADTLEGENEIQSLNAAYELAAIGNAAIPALVEAVHSPVHSVACNAAHGLIVIGEDSVPPLIEALQSETVHDQTHGYIAFALGELGEAAGGAVPALTALLHDKTTFVRQHAVEALGLIRNPASLVVPALCEALLNDPDNFTRFTAALALARVGKDAAAAVHSLEKALNDPYRYVPGAASEALARIRTDEALDVLLPYLQKARWCPVTTSRNTY
ncbi:phytanoyl-CoA dioxygenase [Paenibacillus contaminans]|uniref:Phytanoyl-CoA dioxygenase n=2 Tax=Paenibacillus contaminans TaxID=450362 RepID=A0A329MWK5_9BACL|nr:phytanoyl-CoA dioxygenase [Paenibacillus contaminans]